MQASDIATKTWRQELKSRGFRAHKRGTFGRSGLTAQVRHGWMAFQQPVPPTVDALTPDADQPGLWKLFPVSDQTLCHEFHLLTSMAGSDSEEDGDHDSTTAACVDWVLATAKGSLPGGWEAPSRPEVAGWIPQGGLSVQSGPFAVQGSLVCEPDRLKISFPLIHELSDQLSQNRWQWLQQTLLDAQQRWRLVRIVVRQKQATKSIAAEVDLSGAPRWILEELFTVSLDAVRWVVSWLICPVGLLADPTVKCDTWEEPPAKFYYGGNCHE